MLVYSHIVRILGYFNFATCAILTIYGYVIPEKLQGGTNANAIGSMFSLLGFHIMLVMLAVFMVKVGDLMVDRLLRFTVFNGVLFAVLLINLFFCLNFGDSYYVYVENGSSVTRSKLMMYLAGALLLNLTAIITTTNYIRYFRNVTKGG